MTIRQILVLWGFLLSIFSINLFADVKTASIFSDNMVLQRDIQLPVWGTADPEEKITVSIAGQALSAVADAKGHWSIKLNPMKANKEAQKMIVEGKNKQEFANILIGDVWLCSGQSNMAFTVDQGCNAKEETVNSDNPLIRHVNIGRSYSILPQDELPKVKWLEASPEYTGKFTAAGYFFAKEVVKETGVPIGLIAASWGGTKIEPWIPAEGFKTMPQLKSIADTIVRPENVENERKFPSKDKKDQEYTGPTRIFNSMINPLAPYGIKGVLWYQGEANGGEGEIYTHKMNTLISSWRTLWKQGDFPFYYVQLANFRAPNPDKPAGGDVWTKTREAQLKVLTLVPNTGMAVAIDIGEAGDIHPKNKQDIGKRLAAWALAKNYDKKIVYSGPLFKDFKIEGSKIRIFFNHPGTGLISGKKNNIAAVEETPDEKLRCFALAGADKKWYWADAVIDGDTVLVSSDKVTEPAAVRYAFTMNPAGANLYNKEGFPASPFRTDNW